jgi:hypothetical protein
MAASSAAQLQLRPMTLKFDCVKPGSFLPQRAGIAKPCAHESLLELTLKEEHSLG